MILSLVRFFRGWVEIRAEGKFPERLLNMTARYGLNLWNPYPKKGEITASMLLCDYKKIRPIARKARVRTRVTKRHGFPFFANKYKPRIGLVVGEALGIIIMIVLSNFVWSVNIVGTSTISSTRLEEVVAANGAGIGSYLAGIDVDSVERETIRDIEEIGWLSINLTGCIANIEVKEKIKKPEINMPTNPSNVKAKCDGFITDINAQKGTTVVQPLSAVTKGDLLVSGAVETELNTTQYLHARADVFADVISNKELKIQKQFDYYSLSENKTNRSRLQLFSAEFPFTISFSQYQSSANSLSSQNLCINDVVLPVGVLTETTNEMFVQSLDITQPQAESAFKNQLLLYEVFEKPDSRVVSRNINITQSSNDYICSVNYVFNENIAENIDFSVTE